MQWQSLHDHSLQVAPHRLQLLTQLTFVNCVYHLMLAELPVFLWQSAPRPSNLQARQNNTE